MYAKILRKLYNLILIPFTFNNWIKVMWYAFVMYLPKSYPKKVVLLGLRAGPKLKINLSNIYDLGGILEVFARKVYTPDLIRMQNIARVVDIGATTGNFSIYITSFDKINAIAMEYHIFDNGENLDSLKRILTDSGFSIVTTPKNVYGSGYLYAYKK